MVLKIGFLSFWEGGDINEFKERAFFKPFRNSGVSYKECNPYNEECHIVFICVFGYPDINKIKGSPILISFRTEPKNWFCFNEPLCKYRIGFEPDSEKSLYYPLWAIYLHDYYEKRNKSISKDKFCSFIVTNPVNKERNNIFEYISRHYKQVDSLGRFNNNVGFILPKGDFEYPSRYKFNICFENTKSNKNYLYITEKIIWSYTYGSIPIYWGNCEIETYFNKGTFINCNNLSNQEIIDKISEIDSNQELYNEMVSLDPFKGNDYISYFSDKFMNFMKKILMKEKGLNVYDFTV